MPLYWEYYSVMSLGLGYTNLFQYEVSGRIYGTSEKTGKQTNRKKTIMVNARSLEDAKAAAAELGVMPPYAGVEFVDTSPSYEQFNYLHGAGIPAPYFICALDMSALLTRYEDGDNEKCPEYLFEMATRYPGAGILFPVSSVGQILYLVQPAGEHKDGDLLLCGVLSGARV